MNVLIRENGDTVLTSAWNLSNEELMDIAKNSEFPGSRHEAKYVLKQRNVDSKGKIRCRNCNAIQPDPHTPDYTEY